MSFLKALGSDTGKRVSNDYYPTPPIATYALVQMVDLPTRIWEPAAGRGHMALELQRLGHEVYCSDLHAYPDPLVPDIEADVDFLGPWHAMWPAAGRGIVTNPPYRQARAFAERALELSDFVALLCRIQFLESEARLSLFKRHPLTWVLPFSARFDFSEAEWAKRGHAMGGMICNCWFVWDRQARGWGTRLRIIDTKAMLAKRALEMAE